MKRQIAPLWLWSLVVIFPATVLAYWPALHGGFIWNDSDYVTRPALQSLHGLYRIWFDLGSTEQYYPLLHTACWIEHRLWGDAAAGYHLLNVLLHATSACLLVAIVRRCGLPSPAALLAGLIFALHPVAVESVAWIAEQKNTLSTVFYLSAALVYLRYDESRQARLAAATPAPATGGERAAYFLASGWFGLALLSKSVTASLPAALLVVFWWRRGRLSWRQDVIPLLPWFLVGAAFGLFTGWVEHQYIGARGAAFDLNLVERSLVAGRAIWFYLGKLLWPASLIFIYPRWEVSAMAPGQYLFPVSAAAGLVGLYALRHRTRGPLAAALFFVGTLFPTLGFFNIYAFVFSFVADHWQYLASIGIITFAAGSWARWLRRTEAAAADGGAWIVPAVFAVAGVCVLGALTWRQSRMYTDMETFYTTTLAKNPTCWLAHNNLGNLLMETGREAEAITHYEAALRLKPDSSLTECNLGVAFDKQGDAQKAVEHYRRALQLEPQYAKAHHDLGSALARLDQMAEALAEFQEAVRINPEYADAQLKLGVYLLQAGRVPEALPHLQAAAVLRPNDAELQYNLGSVLAQSGRVEESVAHFARAVELAPDDADARTNLGNALMMVNRIPEAISQYQAALRLKPDQQEARANLDTALHALSGRQ